MNIINELTQKRENLLVEIASVTTDLKEYIKYPVETVCVEQIKYKYGFILREIKDIDAKLRFILLSQSETLKTDLDVMDKEVEKSVSEKRFIVNDVPKLHWSMFEDLNPI
jgi:hypothetical protein